MGDKAESPAGADLLTLAQASRHFAEAQIKKNDWSGLPVPIPGLDLVLEPRYKHKNIDQFRWSECHDENGMRHEIPEDPAPAPSDLRRVNSWRSEKHQLTYFIFQNPQGRATLRIGTENRFSFTMRTLDAAAAWPLEAEQRAQRKLATLIPADQFELYQLTGHFAETSKRSQITYLFRRCRPTIAMREHDEWTLPLCALCLHPIGYYGRTWAGVMCPTDEIIAHLLMMRGCEHKYWANANQHPLDHPNAGM